MVKWLNGFIVLLFFVDLTPFKPNKLQKLKNYCNQQTFKLLKLTNLQTIKLT